MLQNFRHVGDEFFGVAPVLGSEVTQYRATGRILIRDLYVQ